MRTEILSEETSHIATSVDAALTIAESLEETMKKLENLVHSGNEENRQTHEIKVLYIEDNRSDYILLQEALQNNCINLESAASIKSAKRKLKQEKYDFLIIDAEIEGNCGLDILDDFPEYENKFVVLSGLQRSYSPYGKKAEAKSDKGWYSKTKFIKQPQYKLDFVQNLFGSI